MDRCFPAGFFALVFGSFVATLFVEKLCTLPLHLLNPIWKPRNALLGSVILAKTLHRRRNNQTAATQRSLVGRDGKNSKKCIGHSALFVRVRTAQIQKMNSCDTGHVAISKMNVFCIILKNLLFDYVVLTQMCYFYGQVWWIFVIIPRRFSDGRTFWIFADICRNFKFAKICDNNYVLK